MVAASPTATPEMAVQVWGAHSLGSLSLLSPSRGQLSGQRPLSTSPGRTTEGFRRSKEKRCQLSKNKGKNLEIKIEQTSEKQREHVTHRRGSEIFRNLHWRRVCVVGCAHRARTWHTHPTPHTCRAPLLITE